MNLPNQLTLARLGLTALFVGVVSLEWDLQALVALILFVLAGLTDWLDGYLARKWNQITDFGKLADPLADKIMVTAALFFLVFVDQVPLWMAVLMVAREFLITGLRLVAAGKGVVLAAERLGKHKTVSQIVATIAALGYLACDEVGMLAKRNFMSHGAVETLRQSVGWLFAWAVLITVWSGAAYFLKNRKLVFGPAGTPAPPGRPAPVAEAVPVSGHAPAPPALGESGAAPAPAARNAPPVLARPSAPPVIPGL